MRKVNPLYVFTGLSLVTLAAFASVSYDDWPVRQPAETGQPVAQQLAAADPVAPATGLPVAVAEPAPAEPTAVELKPPEQHPGESQMAMVDPAPAPVAREAAPAEPNVAPPEPAAPEPKAVEQKPAERQLGESQPAMVDPAPAPVAPETAPAEPEAASAEPPSLPKAVAEMPPEPQPADPQLAMVDPAPAPVAREAAPAEPEVASTEPPSLPKAVAETPPQPQPPDPELAMVDPAPGPLAPEPAPIEPEAALPAPTPPSPVTTAEPEPAPAMPAQPEPPSAPIQAIDPVPASPPEPKQSAPEPTEFAQPEAGPSTKPPPVAEQPSREKPSFDTVRVDATGDAIAAGEAAPGAEVTLKLDGREIGKTTANADGSWVVVPDKPLPPGAGALSVEQKSPGDPEPVESDESVAVAVPESRASRPMVALVEPDAPVRVIQAPEPQKPLPQKSVALDAIDYTDRGDIVFSGRADAGTSVRLYVDNVAKGDAVADGRGEWTFTGGAEIAAGNHALRVDRLDGSGKVVSRIELPFVRESSERVAALAGEQETAEPPATLATPEPAAPPEMPAMPKVPEPPKSEASAPEPKVAAAAPPSETVTPPETAETEKQDRLAAPDSEPDIAAAAPSVQAPPRKAVGRVVIQPGNNLWKLSRVIYGRGVHYTVIFEANKDQIRNPSRIYPGQIFTTPNAVPPEAIDPKRKQPLTAAEGGAPLP